MPSGGECIMFVGVAFRNEEGDEWKKEFPNASEVTLENLEEEHYTTEDIRLEFFKRYGNTYRVGIGVRIKYQDSSAGEIKLLELNELAETLKPKVQKALETLGYNGPIKVFWFPDTDM